MGGSVPGGVTRVTRGASEGVAVGHAARLESAAEPFDALSRGAVREGVGIHATSGHFLHAVVADRAGGGDAFVDVAGLEDVALRGVVAPDAGVTVGLQL